MPFVLCSQPTGIFETPSDTLLQMAESAHRRYAEIMQDIESMLDDHSKDHLLPSFLCSLPHPKTPLQFHIRRLDSRASRSLSSWSPALGIFSLDSHSKMPSDTRIARDLFHRDDLSHLPLTTSDLSSTQLRLWGFSEQAR